MGANVEMDDKRRALLVVRKLQERIKELELKQASSAANEYQPIR